jgi:hypothetical protein
MTSKSRFVGPGSTVKNTLFLIMLLGIGIALYFRLRYLLSPPAPKSTQIQNQSVSSSPGEILITFTKRSPLSGPRDLARRLPCRFWIAIRSRCPDRTCAPGSVQIGFLS